MKVQSRDLRQHTGVFSADEIRGVVTTALQRNLGLADAAVMSSSAEVGSDGSVTVQIVEAVSAKPGDPSLNPGDGGAPTAPAVPQIPGAPA